MSLMLFNFLLFVKFTGGQYSDGTTDTTRTFHFGQPNDFEKEAYTRVLMGSIDLARAVFISNHGTTDSRLDILARYKIINLFVPYYKFCNYFAIT